MIITAFLHAAQMLLSPSCFWLLGTRQVQMADVLSWRRLCPFNWRLLLLGRWIDLWTDCDECVK